jgi:hypothetical protein
MTAPRAAFIVVDGVNGAAVASAGRRLLVGHGGRRRGGMSRWDASGLFEQLVVAEKEAGLASARTLLLLYAADLAFRLRWQIEPALAAGKVVVAAPYVDTAIAFGRAAGLRGGWLTNLFQFALKPGERHYVNQSVPRSGAPRGFVEFACAQVAGRHLSLTRHELAARARARLAAAHSMPRRRGKR